MPYDPKALIEQTYTACRPGLSAIGTRIDRADLTDDERRESAMAVAAALLSMAIDAHRLVGGSSFTALNLYAAADVLATEGRPS